MRRYSKRRRDPPSSKPPERQDLDQRLNTLLQDCMDSFQTGDPFELSSDTIGAPEPPQRIDKSDFFNVLDDISIIVPETRDPSMEWQAMKLEDFRSHELRSSQTSKNKIQSVEEDDLETILKIAMEQPSCKPHVDAIKNKVLNVKGSKAINDAAQQANKVQMMIDRLASGEPNRRRQRQKSRIRQKSPAQYSRSRRVGSMADSLIQRQISAQGAKVIQEQNKRLLVLDRNINKLWEHESSRIMTPKGQRRVGISPTPDLTKERSPSEDCSLHRGSFYWARKRHEQLEESIHMKLSIEQQALEHQRAGLVKFAQDLNDKERSLRQMMNTVVSGNQGQVLDKIITMMEREKQRINEEAAKLSEFDQKPHEEPNPNNVVSEYKQQEFQMQYVRAMLLKKSRKRFFCKPVLVPIPNHLLPPYAGT